MSFSNCAGRRTGMIFVADLICIGRSRSRSRRISYSNHLNIFAQESKSPQPKTHCQSHTLAMAKALKAIKEMKAANAVKAMKETKAANAVKAMKETKTVNAVKAMKETKTVNAVKAKKEMKAAHAMKAMKETKAMKSMKAAQSVKSMKKVDVENLAKQPPPTDEQLECLHDLRTSASSNAFIVQQKCEICMLVITRRRR